MTRKQSGGGGGEEAVVIILAAAALFVGHTQGLFNIKDLFGGGGGGVVLPPPTGGGGGGTITPPPSNSGIDQTAALNFIKNSYIPSVQMLEEAPGFNVFWLWNDQLLGQICLKHIDPEMATTIDNKMNSFGVTMRTPWATLDPKYRNNFSVKTASEPTIQAGTPAIRYSDYNGDSEFSVNNYADIAFLSAIHHYYNNNLTLAKQAYDAGRGMWNGEGMLDAGNITGDYAVYKVALGMLAEKITGFTPIGIPDDWFAPFQNENGGITTDKTGGVPSGSQNIETTAAVLFAVNPSLLTEPAEEEEEEELLFPPTFDLITFSTNGA